MKVQHHQQQKQQQQHSFLDEEVPVVVHYDENNNYNNEEAIPSETEADLFLAKELAQLSSMERNGVYEDLHGVSEPFYEEEQFMDQCLARMDQELKMATASANTNTNATPFLAITTTAFHVAKSLDPTYVNPKDVSSSVFTSRQLRSCCGGAAYDSLLSTQDALFW